MTDDEREIRDLVLRWAAAVHDGNLDGVLADHAQDIVMFDVPPPEDGVRGLDAYRETWPPFFEWQRSGASFEIVSLDVTAGADAAFAWALLLCATAEELERDPSRRLRLTVGLRKEVGRWMVAHEHHSFKELTPAIARRTQIASCPVDVRLLGPLEVLGDTGRAAALPGAKLRILTTLLALDAGAVVSVDRLIETLYGDDLPARPSNALHLLVRKLRRALDEVQPDGAQVVVTKPPGYLLAVERDDVDVFRFERLAAEGRRVLDDQPDEARARLREALSLWRGEALADVAYDDVATVERSRLEELRLEALEDRIEADLAAGDHADVVAELERLTAEHPVRERLWGQLIVALYRGSRQADAMRAYQQAREALVDVGLEPGPALRRLEAAVLAQDPSLDGPVRRNRSAGNLPFPLTELVGRKQELADLRLLLGVHRLVTVVGPGGAGKTRLATEVARSLADPVSDGAWIVELAPVDPAAVVSTTAAALGVDQGGLAGLAAALAGRELLLVLDNCEHVIDEAARLVHALLTRAPNVRVMATSREGLGVEGEHVYPLPPLGIEAAVELFVERVEAAGGPALLADEEGRRGPSTSAPVSTGSRSPWSWPHRGLRTWTSPRSWPGSRTASGC